MCASNDMTGLVLGAIFGSLFLFTCIISAIKAVRDRKRMKVRIAERERLKRERESLKPEIEINNIEVPPPIIHTGISGRTGGSAEGHPRTADGHYTTADAHYTPADGRVSAADAAPAYSSLYPIELSNSYSPVNGIDNLNYAQSHADFQFADAEQGESQKKPKQCVRNAVVPQPRAKRALSSDNIDTRQHALNGTRACHNLPPECLAVQKQIRRNSYELAIYEHAWMAPEAYFASSQAIANTYNYGNGGTRTSSVAFGNQAFDKSAVGLDNTGFAKEDHGQT